MILKKLRFGFGFDLGDCDMIILFSFGFIKSQINLCSESIHQNAFYLVYHWGLSTVMLGSKTECYEKKCILVIMLVSKNYMHHSIEIE